MPMRSIAQSRFFHWADEHPGQAKRERGIKPGVAAKFIADSHGQSLKNLPERVEAKAAGGAVCAPKPFRW